MTVENASLLRTIKSYDRDCKKKFSFETGIKERCVLNDVNNFHVCDNICMDYMHDVFGGLSSLYFGTDFGRFDL